MGKMLVKLKLMPESADVNYEDVKVNVTKLVEEGEGEKINFEEEPIAFGLKALIVGFTLDESKELEPIQNKLGETPGISSCEMGDLRRAFG